MGSGSVLIEGYLIDADDQFLYIGSDEDTIMDAIKISDVARVTVHEKATEEVFDPNVVKKGPWN